MEYELTVNHNYNMKIINTFAILGTILVLTQIPAKADTDYDDNNDYDYTDDYYNEPVHPHQEHRLCDSRHCENTCAIPDAADKPCPFRLCHEGYFCETGYVRELETDQCILLSDCPVTTNSYKSQNSV